MNAHVQMHVQKVGLLIVSYITSHLLAFVIEYVYQTWCYPITVSGFFTSVFTNSSPVCKTLRKVVHILEYV